MSPFWLIGWLVLLAIPMLAVVVALVSRRTGGARVAQVAGSGLLYAVLGPPLGALLIAVPGLLVADDPEPVTMLLFLVAMSYVPGLVPALVGGACMGLLRPMLGSTDRQLSADAHFELAEVRRAQKRFADAATLYLAAATTTDNSELAANALFVAGVSYEQAAQPQDAIRCYRRLLDGSGGNPEWVSRARQRLAELGAGG